MRALRFDKTGSLNDLKISDMPKPVPGPNEVLVEVEAAAVNPSDIKNVLGGMHETTVPRTPGRDFAGTVVAGPDEWLGQSVFGSGGDLGFRRDGSHAEFVAVPEVAVVLKPGRLDFVHAAAVGLPYITAWAALMEAARLQPAETVLIPGVTGAVGSAAARIAKWRGCRVLGAIRKQPEISKAGDPPVDVWITLESTELSKGTRAATQGKGADVVFDVVGGPLFEPCLASLARRGRQVAIASTGQPRVSLNLLDFYHNESRLLGLDTLKLGFAEAAAILRQLAPGFESGEFPASDCQTFPLHRAPEIYRQMHESKLKGKVVLIP
jgi:NADPH:quinone reductase-like Zn-dependent oxidoreductase